MLTRLSLGLLAIISCCGYSSVETYRLRDSLDQYESCPANAHKGEILNPRHKTYYNIQPNSSEDKREPHRYYRPVLWLMRIINIRGIMRAQPEELKEKKPHVLRRDKRVSDLQQPPIQDAEKANKKARMIVILEKRAENEPHQPGQHCFM